ncbi:hypothetical protein BLA29_012278 [Euroglyphus maynei]|uniref:Uncharacterized protein n=1 Tax=Euroglyphus maynei TaxID=6958 RepID=A0A1Y3BS48_EURMA|nr:hypothetical protein BLA29_012278 [Euroglyphus maynei]
MDRHNYKVVLMLRRPYQRLLYEDS